MRVRVKICGITNLEDAITCCEFGADAIGFVFFPGSPRYISFSKAEKIISKLPPFITKVGVFVNPSYDEIKKGINIGINAVQLHGEEKAEEYNSIKTLPLIKAFRISGPPEINALKGWKFVSAFLFEGRKPGGYGGVGARFNPDWVKGIVKKWKIIVAGGLTPDNVKKVVKQLKPYGVDVSSGVETSLGKKDKKLIKRFIKNAKNLPIT